MSFRQWFIEEIVPVLRTAKRVPGTDHSRTFLVPRETYEEILAHWPSEQRPQTAMINLSSPPSPVYVVRVEFVGDQHGYWIGTTEKPGPVLDDIWTE
jgi:hypothetical protein